MGKDYISFGSGVRLLSEDVYREEMGLSKKAFRKLCRVLKIPTIEIGKTKYVEMTSFVLAMRAITRISSPDFLVPGCETLRRKKTTFQATELDYDQFERDFEAVVADLVAAQGINTKRLRKDVRKSAKEVAKRLTNAGMQFIPTQALRNHDQQTKASQRDFEG